MFWWQDTPSLQDHSQCLLIGGKTIIVTSGTGIGKAIAKLVLKGHKSSLTRMAAETVDSVMKVENRLTKERSGRIDGQTIL